MLLYIQRLLLFLISRKVMDNSQCLGYSSCWRHYRAITAFLDVSPKKIIIPRCGHQSPRNSAAIQKRAGNANFYNTIAFSRFASVTDFEYIIKILLNSVFVWYWDWPRLYSISFNNCLLLHFGISRRNGQKFVTLALV